MIRELASIFQDDLSLTAVGEKPFSNVIDLKAPGDSTDWPYLIAQVSADFTGGAGATLNVKLQTSDDAAFTAPVSLMESGAIPLTGLKAGKYLIRGKIPLGVRRYLRVVAIVGTAAMTAGKVSAWVSPSIPHDNGVNG